MLRTRGYRRHTMDTWSATRLVGVHETSELQERLKLGAPRVRGGDNPTSPQML
jgi:hypothetical protein